ncbi:hypothetical protein [Thiothrix nivea]|uniref:Lipoprotein n=1 Tax=Thiothrix nivea (strain ATCC 35100 / DSM 5205 / JP2) TaxID=870187 RepID=A0A656HH40_THINJ|nr:hypothetical protein [Thiothrix nivea]EIJ35522.1 hypothetical protein Thini_2996 [Thiothrix nivea DSM 5205]
MKRILTTAALLALLPPAFALDAACDPLVKSSEAKIAQPAWHVVVEGGGTKLESIKVDDQFFMSQGDKWMKSPMNLDEAEKIAIKQMQDGGIKITNCKDEGTETVDGVEMNILSYTTEIPGSGFPAVTAKLYIGKDDGLPYKSVAEDEDKTTTVTRYQDVVAPKL